MVGGVVPAKVTWSKYTSDTGSVGLCSTPSSNRAETVPAGAGVLVTEKSRYWSVGEIAVATLKVS